LSAAATARAEDVPARSAPGQEAAARPGARGRDENTRYWKDALIPIEDQPGLPRVLLIGDSISVCYTMATREELKGEANVHRIPENGGHTGKALESIDGWLGAGKWDVVHFNWGLHDLRQGVGTSVEQFEQNLRKLVKTMQATGARLVWCSITPLPADVPRSAAGNETVLAYNAVARKVMQENAIAIDDLHAFARPQLAKLQMPRSAHFTEEGAKVLAKQVARSIREGLEKAPATAPADDAVTEAPPPVKGTPPATPHANGSPSATEQSVAAGGLEPILGARGRLLLDEAFAGDTLPEGWNVKSGKVRFANGALRTSQTRGERLCLFNRDLPMQDMAIQVDFEFDGGRGINVSVNPSPGELKKHGHLYSVMITPRMWNITEHNDKGDRASRSRVLVSAMETFEQGKRYTMLLENRGDDVVARIEGKRPLRASGKDFRVKKPGIEFRVLGRDEGEVVFDNLRVWELK
jgi:hypothetical protein